MKKIESQTIAESFGLNTISSEELFEINGGENYGYPHSDELFSVGSQEASRMPVETICLVSTGYRPPVLDEEIKHKGYPIEFSKPAEEESDGGK